MKKAFVFLFLMATFSTFAEAHPSVTWIDVLKDWAMNPVSTMGFYERNTLVEAQSAHFNAAILGANDLRAAGYVMQASDNRSQSSIVVNVVRAGAEVFVHRIPRRNDQGVLISPGAIEIGISTPVNARMSADIARFRRIEAAAGRIYLDPKNQGMAEMLDHELRPEENLKKVVIEIAKQNGLSSNSVDYGLARVFEYETGKYVVVRRVYVSLNDPKGDHIDNVIQETIHVARRWLKDYPEYNSCLRQLETQSSSMQLPDGPL